ncbi:MAG: ATP-binding protein [Desulfobacca sp.]|uniref:ATP-binding protein n=1 Tax=Desulfobacca sp. TaxID=2067990 RepID=UPI00404A7004
MRFLSNQIYLIIGLVTLIVLAIAFVLGLMSSNKMREVISEQFNQQQLIIARSVASDIEEKFDFIRNELHTLNLSPAIQYLEVSWPNRMQITMDNVKAYGVVEIGLVAATATGAVIHRLDNTGRHYNAPINIATVPFCRWAQEPEHRNKFFIQRTTWSLRNGAETSYLLLAVPTYQVSLDESHPQALGDFTGALYMLIDPFFLAQKYAQDIRSGHTGYAWIIDAQGDFLYHPEREFIGKNAFEIREKRAARVSFDEINRIQREKMLAGQEGTSYYWSGWHRGVQEVMKKFIAFAPIRIAADNNSLIWSVAVVAPQSEVEGAIHEVYIRQFLLQGLLIFIILLAGGTGIYYESRWASSLAKEVARKTLELKKSNEELSISEKRYKSLVESAEDSILTVDTHGDILSVNRFGAQFLGYTVRGIVGKTLKVIFPGRVGEVLQGQVERIFREKSGFRTVQEVALGDKKYTLNFTMTPVRDEEDRVQSILIIIHDMTAVKRMEEQLYHTEKLASLGQLAAGVAHEINNPMAIILGYTDMLLEKVEEGSKEYKILKTIERQGNNCKRIVENLMSFARMPEGVQYDTDVNRNIELVMEVVQNTLLTKKIEFVLHLAPNLPRVRGDTGQLQQVFMNLITNAVKAMPKGGKLTITSRLHQRGDQVEVLITDTGEGIRREHLSKIFDPFFTTRKVGEGTGLGLSVSYAIVSKYGGNILCTSKSQEEYGEAESGSTFTVVLPVVVTAGEKYGSTGQI